MTFAFACCCRCCCCIASIWSFCFSSFPLDRGRGARWESKRKRTTSILQFSRCGEEIRCTALFTFNDNHNIVICDLLILAELPNKTLLPFRSWILTKVSYLLILSTFRWPFISKFKFLGLHALVKYSDCWPHRIRVDMNLFFFLSFICFQSLFLLFLLFFLIPFFL